jgi:dihydropteroate synthase
VADLVNSQGNKLLVMGILNVTPDSFYDGGRWFSVERAIQRGKEMFELGADVVDVGGESTRPGAEPVGADEEMRRVLPVVEELAKEGRVSVDTRKAEVAAEALRCGASLLNDVSASLEDVAARSGAGWVAMHMRGEPRTMQQAPSYEDVVREVRDYLDARARAGQRVGVSEVWVDPGIGFGKTKEHNLALLARLEVIGSLGFPVLVGVSRKSFLGTFGQVGGKPLPPEERLEASLAMAVLCAIKGVSMLRVHDVFETIQALSGAGFKTRTATAPREGSR